MARTIDEILNEAEQVIAKTASKKVAQAPSMDEVTSLAQMLMDPQPTKTASNIEYTLTEKVAAAVALIDTLNHLEQLTKVAHFEDLARNKGIPEDRIQNFLEKQAINSASHYAIPAALGAISGAYVGHKAGKKKGYDQAMDDISSALND